MLSHTIDDFVLIKRQHIHRTTNPFEILIITFIRVARIIEIP